MMLVSFLFLLFFFILFFFNDTATTEIYTLSLHDVFRSSFLVSKENRTFRRRLRDAADLPPADLFARMCNCAERSEEHTSELQSHSDLVCRLLLEKKKEK